LAVSANTARKLFHIWRDLKQYYQGQAGAYTNPWAMVALEAAPQIQRLAGLGKQGKKLLPMHCYNNE
jgi:hypothetical protein